MSTTEQPPKKTRRLFWWVAGVFVLVVFGPVLLGFGLFGWIDLSERVRRTSFDAVAWQDSVRVHDDWIRSRMVHDLLEGRDFNGWSQAEVVRLLGPVTRKLSADFALAYWLGPKRPMGIDSEWLVFRVDTAGRVVEARVISD